MIVCVSSLLTVGVYGHAPDGSTADEMAKPGDGGRNHSVFKDTG